MENAFCPLITEAIKNKIDINGNFLLDEVRIHYQKDEFSPHYVIPASNC